MKPALLDVIELIVERQEDQLRAGTRGTIVHCHHTQEAGKNGYEVEFATAEGETVALCAVPIHQFIVVWKAETEQWVSTTQRILQIIERLPEERQTEMLDFAQFLSFRSLQSPTYSLEQDQ